MSNSSLVKKISPLDGGVIRKFNEFPDVTNVLATKLSDKENGIYKQIDESARGIIADPAKFLDGYHREIDPSLFILDDDMTLVDIAGRLYKLGHIFYAAIHSGYGHLFDEYYQGIVDFFDKCTKRTEILIDEGSDEDKKAMQRALPIFFINIGLYFYSIGANEYARKAYDLAKDFAYVSGLRQYYFDALTHIVGDGLSHEYDAHELVVLAREMNNFYSRYTDNDEYVQQLTHERGIVNMNLAELLELKSSSEDLLKSIQATSPQNHIPSTVEGIVSGEGVYSGLFNNGGLEDRIRLLVNKLQEHQYAYALNTQNKGGRYSIMTAKIIIQIEINLGKIAAMREQFGCSRELSFMLEGYISPDYWPTENSAHQIDPLNQSLISGLSLRNISIELIEVFNLLYSIHGGSLSPQYLEDLLYSIARGIAGFDRHPFPRISRFLIANRHNSVVQRFTAIVIDHFGLKNIEDGNMTDIRRRKDPVSHYLTELIKSKKDVDSFLEENFGDKWAIYVGKSFMKGNASLPTNQSNIEELVLCRQPYAVLFYIRTESSTFVGLDIVAQWIWSVLSPVIMTRMSNIFEEIIGRVPELCREVAELQRKGGLTQGIRDIVERVIEATTPHRRRKNEGDGFKDKQR